MRCVSLPLHRRYAHLSSLLSSCGTHSNIYLGSAIHAAILKQPSFFRLDSPNNHHHRNILVTWNSLLFMYSKNGNLSDARKVFDEMPTRDTITWNSLILGFLQKHDLTSTFRILKEMRRTGDSPWDHATFTTALSACAEHTLLPVAAVIHGAIISSGFSREKPVANALVTAYFKCESPAEASKVFDEMPERNVVGWTAMVSGLAQRGLWIDSLYAFRDMRRCSIPTSSPAYSSTLTACSGARALLEARQIHSLLVKSGNENERRPKTALTDAYCKCGQITDARRLFESSAGDRDAVSYTILLAGFARSGMEDEAFGFFAEITRSGMEVMDADMVSAVLGAFGASAPHALGRQIHAAVVKMCLTSNVFVGNGLINMYSKCGNLEDSINVFDQMGSRNSVSWNSLIAAFARHGRAVEALQLYESMRRARAHPTDVTFLSLLHACSHVGAVEEGLEFVRSMVEDYGIEPRSQHYACVVDILGRAGRVAEAKGFVDSLPTQPSAFVWQALLGASAIGGNLEVGKYAMEKLLRAAPPEDAVGAYVALANICSSLGSWKEKALIVKKMKDVKGKKEIAMSWIEVSGQMHSFVVGCRNHPRVEAIYETLEGLLALMRLRDISWRNEIRTHKVI